MDKVQLETHIDLIRLSIFNDGYEYLLYKQIRKAHGRRPWTIDYIYGAEASRVRLLGIAGCPAIFRVAWAEVDEFNVFCQALAAGEHQPFSY
jgi:hypothetical protein